MADRIPGRHRARVRRVAGWRPGRAGRRLPTLFPVVICLVAIGAVVLAASVGAVLRSGDESTAAASSTAPTGGAPPVAPRVSTAAGASGAPQSGGVADLADPDWVAAMAEATGIPPRAMAAYAGAALAEQTRSPDCHLGWNTLAAIGQVESGHGGDGLGSDGVVRPRLVGVALDGQGVAAVPDTDGGRLDGDRSWDRAVGPLQFLPGTWEQFGRDGNGDGTADVDNIDDATVSAAAYLCSSGADLSESADWIAAISSYNAGTRYNNQVAEAAEAYAAAEIP